MLPAISPSTCKNSITCPPSQFQVILFYISLYTFALAQGGHKPSVQAFGADQFDQTDPKEHKSRASFFNWWFFGMAGGVLAANVILSYIQDNVGWGFGFGIPCVLMGLNLIVFLLGTRTYRYYPLQDESPYVRLGKAFLKLARIRRAASDDQEAPFLLRLEDGDQVEDAKGLLRVLGIWTCCLIYGIVSAQIPTFFVKQGGTLDRRIANGLEVPPAALQSFVNLSMFTVIPVYERIIVPVARKLTKLPSGITMLQRIGAGIAIQSVLVAVAAVVEMRRLEIARDHGLVDEPKATIPMSIWWLAPQYILSGISDVFAVIGLQEFFYDQVPDELRSLGVALYLTVFGFANFISSALVSVIDEVTRKEGESWFSDNLNRAHLDYFYWLLALLNAIGFVFYLYFAKSYVYKKEVVTILL